MKLPTRDRCLCAIRNPEAAVRFSFREIYRPFLERKATNVLDRDWNVLVVLDACRVDLLESVASEYDFLPRIDTIHSVASQSEEWMRATFTDDYADEMAETAIITGNPFSETVLDSSELAHLDEAWRYAWDDEIGTIPARHLTDRAIRYAREHRPERLIVHYMQPHLPTVPEPRLSTGPAIADFGSGRVSVWERLRSGDLSVEEVRSAGIRNLRYVLDDVEILVNNIDADRVAITADHGEGYGERGIYGHPRETVINAVREVPWVETTATDTRTHEPDGDEPITDTNDRDEMLRALGYR